MIICFTMHADSCPHCGDTCEFGVYCRFLLPLGVVYAFFEMHVFKYYISKHMYVRSLVGWLIHKRSPPIASLLLSLCSSKLARRLR